MRASISQFSISNLIPPPKKLPPINRKEGQAKASRAFKEGKNSNCQKKKKKEGKFVKASPRDLSRDKVEQCGISCARTLPHGYVVVPPRQSDVLAEYEDTGRASIPFDAVKPLALG